MIMYLALLFLFTGSLFWLMVWSKVHPQSDVADAERKEPADPAELQRPLEPVEECLEEIHQLGAGNCSAVLRLTSKASLMLKYVEQAVENLTVKHPLLRCAIVTTGKKGARRYFQEISPDLGMILKRSDRQADEWQTVLEENCDVVFDTTRSPLWAVILLKETFNKESNEYNNTMIFTCHHGIVDGISIMNITKQFTQIVNSIAGKGRVQQSLECYPMGSGVYSLAARDLDWTLWQKRLLIPQVLGMLLKFLLPLQSKFTKNGGFFRKFPAAIHSSPNAQSKARFILTKLSEQDYRKLSAVATANNSTFTGAIASVCHFALAKLIQQNEERSTKTQFQWNCAVGLRPNCKPPVHKEYIGCFATAVLLKMEIPAEKDKESFWKVAERTSRKISEEVRKGSPLSFLRLGGLLEAKVAANACVYKQRDLDHGTLDVNTISNIGRFDWTEHDDDTYKMDDAFFLSADHCMRYAFTHYNTTVKERLYWVTRYNPQVVKETTARQYIHLIMETLRNAID